MLNRGNNRASGDLPSGYLSAEFLESTGTQYIDTAVLSGDLSFDAVVRGSAGSSCCIIGGRANDSFGNNILGSVGRKGWQFVYGSWLETAKLTYQPLTKYHIRSVLDTLFVDGVIASRAGVFWHSGSYSLFAFANNRDNTEVNLMSSMQMWHLTIKDKLDIPIRAFIPALDKNGTPCMFDKVSKQPFYNSGTGQFIVGMALEQARKLGRLPSAGGELTVSLPWEAGVDANVQDALATAAENGWTVMVQYREPEVATENISVDYLENDSFGAYMTLPVSRGTKGNKIEIETELYPIKTSEAASGDGNAREVSYGWCNSANYMVTAPGVARAFGSFPAKNWASYKVVVENQQISLLAHNGGQWTYDMSSETTLGNHYLWKASSQDERIIIARRKKHSYKVNGEYLYDLEPMVDAQGVPCMHNSVSGQNFYNSGSGAFIAGFESTEKAALNLATLPVVETGELTVSLPAAAQEEASRVPAAIEVARQRGWTIITQYRD